MRNVRPCRLGFAGLLCGVLVLVSSISQAEELNRWGFGTDIGFTSGTVDGTVFTLGLTADYYLDQAFSVGPLVLVSPTGDLTQVAMAGAARYHIRTTRMNVVPFAGLGFIHVDLDRGAGPGRIDDSATSWYIPLGATVEYPVNPKLALASTLLVNLHSLKVGPLERDNTSVTLMFGVRFGP